MRYSNNSTETEINWEIPSYATFRDIFTDNMDAILSVGQSFIGHIATLNDVTIVGKVEFKNGDCWYLIDHLLFLSREDFEAQLSI